MLVETLLRCCWKKRDWYSRLPMRNGLLLVVEGGGGGGDLQVGAGGHGSLAHGISSS